VAAGSTIAIAGVVAPAQLVAKYQGACAVLQVGVHALPEGDDIGELLAALDEKI